MAEDRVEVIAAGGERLREVFERTDAFIKEKVEEHQGSEFVAVSHGDPIMSIKV